MADAVDETSTNLVEEFPKPPSYYQDIDVLAAPPVIPEGDPYELVYGESFLLTKLRPLPSRTGPEFAEAMKRYATLNAYMSFDASAVP